MNSLREKESRSADSTIKRLEERNSNQSMKLLELAKDLAYTEDKKESLQNESKSLREKCLRLSEKAKSAEKMIEDYNLFVTSRNLRQSKQSHEKKIPGSNLRTSLSKKNYLLLNEIRTLKESLGNEKSIVREKNEIIRSQESLISKLKCSRNSHVASEHVKTTLKNQFDEVQGGVLTNEDMSGYIKRRIESALEGERNEMRKKINEKMRSKFIASFFISFVSWLGIELYFSKQ